MQILIQYFWSKAKCSTFLASSYVVPTLLEDGPHFEYKNKDIH